MNAVTVEIAKLELKAGETLVLMVPQLFSAEQYERMHHYAKSVLPDGVKVMILSGGVTLAKIAADEGGT